MEVFVGVEELAANAFIAIMESDECNKSVLTLKELEEYGYAVREWCRENSDVQMVLLFSRESTEWAFRNYGDFFKRAGDDSIALKDSVTVSDLKTKFWEYRSVNVRNAFMKVGSSML